MKAIREAQTGKIESDETRKKKSKSAIRRFASGKERERQSKAVKRGMEKRAKMLNTISKSLAADQPTQEDRIIFEQTVSIIETEIGKFSRQEQRIIRMHFYENLTIPKISEKLGISETEIEKKMKKVFAKLAQNKKIKELR